MSQSAARRTPAPPEGTYLGMPRFPVAAKGALGNTQLRKKMLFGSDFPLIHPAKWIEAALQAGFKEEVLPGIMKDNAARVLGLA